MSDEDVEVYLDMDHNDLDDIKLTLAFAHFRDFPFKKAIALYLLAEVLQVRGLKDQIITKSIEIYYRRRLCKPTNRFWKLTLDSRLI